MNFKHITDVTPAQMMRAIKQFLTADDSADGTLWSIESELDAEPSNDNYQGPIVYVFSKVYASSGEKIYMKLVYLDRKISILTSNDYDSANDAGQELRLKGSWKNVFEDNNDEIFVYDSLGNLVPPNQAKVPFIIFPDTFNPQTDVIKRVFLVRKLKPLLDDTSNISNRKETDIFFWCSFTCTEDYSQDPIIPHGYYQHFSGGICGEILTADNTFTNGAGIYASAGSFLNEDERDDSNSKRIFAGAGEGRDGDSITGDNTGCVVSVGLLDGKKTWFYPGSMYDLVRFPFDEALFQPTFNVGFDFTEMTRYCPYSGVRILTPSYVFGKYAGLWRIIGRLPFFYTDLTGLYAGDVVTHVAEDGTEKSFILFPFIYYRCAKAVENKRGYGIPLML